MSTKRGPYATPICTSSKTSGGRWIKTDKNTGEFWEEQPFGFYLNAVGDLLEKKIGRTSTQDELEYIAGCHEAFCLPSECADSIVALEIVEYLNLFDSGSSLDFRSLKEICGIVL